MSLPDYLLEEPDLCPDHGLELPCWQCLDEARELYAEERFEDAVGS